MFSDFIDRLNDRRDATGEAGADAGFTLIELMVVLLILAILLAIAIPTFLGVTKSANDRAAQSNLNTAFTNAKAAYQAAGQSYTGVTIATLQSAEPSLSFVTGNSTGQGVVSVAVSADGNGVVLAALSKAGNCWYLIDNAQAITATNSASTTAPYNSAAAASGTTGAAPGTEAATTSTQYTTNGALTMPVTAGTSYGEAKGDNTATDCNAATPLLSNASANKVFYQVQSGGFPS